MSMPYYVSPEQVMKDKADYARRNIARGRPVVVLAYEGGIAFVAENHSRALHKISEIYDRMAFAAAGKYNEFENLRVAGVRYADLRGYSYDRIDVTARGLANWYAQTLGSAFTQESKPLEVEIVVAEVGRTSEEDQIYRLTYDGSVADEQGFVAMGGQAEQITTGLQERWEPELSLSAALAVAVELLSKDASGTDRRLTSAQLEVAVLDRLRPRRAFRRLAGPLLEALLAPDDPTTDVPTSDDSRPGLHDTLTGVEAEPQAITPGLEKSDDQPGDQPGAGSETPPGKPDEDA
jgi:proteasome alpha subunit